MKQVVGSPGIEPRGRRQWELRKERGLAREASIGEL
jgi:hypothetical protein